MLWVLILVSTRNMFLQNDKKNIYFSVKKVPILELSVPLICHYSALKHQAKFVADDILNFYFFYFSQKTNLDIS